MKTANGLFKDVSEEDWSSWHWQVNHAVRSLEELQQFPINLTDSEKEGIRKTQGRLKMAITPYYLS